MVAKMTLIAFTSRWSRILWPNSKLYFQNLELFYTWPGCFWTSLANMERNLYSGNFAVAASLIWRKQCNLYFFDWVGGVVAKAEISSGRVVVIFQGSRAGFILCMKWVVIVWWGRWWVPTPTMLSAVMTLNIRFLIKMQWRKPQHSPWMQGSIRGSSLPPTKKCAMMPTTRQKQKWCW